MKKKRQKLIAVQVTAEAGEAGAAVVVPVEGGSIEEVLAAWRVVQMQPLGPLAGDGGAPGRYLALLLLEEAVPEEGVGRLGFGSG